ncbi:MAG: GNAT family N-acetyltransferase [Flavobacteriales bacterium]|nr:GNAT family N-acetyltransferase [Flavobacteriales bacterium]
MNNYKSFETDRLFIKPTIESDADFIFELMNTPKWIKNIGQRNINSIEDAKNYINNKILPQLEKLGYSNYTVSLKIDNTKIGTCGLYNREGIDGVDIGFAFLPQHEKMGYAFESSNKIMQIALPEFGIKKISAITIKENLNSQKLIEKLGLSFIKMIKLPNDSEDLMLYSLEYLLKKSN